MGTPTLAFLGLYPWHMEVPRLGVETELQVQVYDTAIATQDLSHTCDLHHSSPQRRILNPLIKARNQTCVRMDTGQVRVHCATTGTPLNFLKCREGTCKDNGLNITRHLQFKTPSLIPPPAAGTRCFYPPASFSFNKWDWMWSCQS